VTRRSVDRYMLFHGGTPAEIKASLLPLHAMFRRERTGTRNVLP
jgi:hypothetical protein